MGTRIGAVGLGGLGRMELDVYDEIDGVEIVAGADVAPASRESFEAAFGAPAYETHGEMLAEHADDLDAVSIVTPHTLHHGQAMDAMDAGLHVFLEKPMVTGLEQAATLVRRAAERDLVLSVGYQRHFHPAFREVKRIVESGRIGAVHMANCYMGQEWIDVQTGTWRTDPSLSGGGQLYDSGSHLLDALLWTTGTTPRSVAAVMDDRDGAVDVNSALAATLDRDGRTVTASIGVSGDGTTMEPREGLVIWGTDGHLHYGGDELTVVEGGDATYTGRVEGDDDGWTLTRRKLTDFVGAIEGDREPTVSGEFGLRVTALTEAAYASVETGRVVDVERMLDEATAAAERPVVEVED